MAEESAIMVEGPWTHRTVSAAGTRFHIAEAGTGPLVLLLHGFPQFWWSWHHQLPALAEAGFRAVAMDLRGYGGSDKPPRGYDPITLASDAAGLVRALGEADATVVGHATGGLLGWTMASYFPAVVRRLAVLSTPHPARLRTALLAGTQGRATRHMIGYQLPMLPERRLRAHEAAFVGRMLRRWSRPGWPDPVTEQLCREAMQLPKVAHCALEPYRWLIRSQARPDGHRYMRRMRRPIRMPVLHLHGSLDSFVPPAAARGSGRYVDSSYQWRLIQGAGHFPHQERPERVGSLLTNWLRDTDEWDV
ncbi:alpha/beta fold hydrolase [Salinactinospora qingdaonensis]|uniref:Alpha/beta hydrolase n=1 Tax=Salinactinospora qingdaonensis TaxID=702744 RepID=A0ABP7F982_9ACTN